MFLPLISNDSQLKKKRINKTRKQLYAIVKKTAALQKAPLNQYFLLKFHKGIQEKSQVNTTFHYADVKLQGLKEELTGISE